MIRIYTLIFCILSFTASAQLGGGNLIDFDEFTSSSGTIWQEYHPFIIIDSTNSHNTWQVGHPNKSVFTSARSLRNAIVTDTIGHYPANDTSVFILKIPGYYPDTANSLAWMEFYYQLDIDSADVAKVEISEDSGHHWINLLDSLPFRYHWAGDPPVLSSSTIGWKRFTLSREIFRAISDTVQFRFTFISDSIDSTRDGWMIDDIEFEYSWEGIAAQIQNPNLISIYPNPSKGNIYLHTTKQYADSKITVYNILGQQVYHSEGPLPNGYLNLPLPDGTYTLKYAAGDEYCVKRIVIAK